MEKVIHIIPDDYKANEPFRTFCNKLQSHRDMPDIYLALGGSYPFSDFLLKDEILCERCLSNPEVILYMLVHHI